MDETFNDTEFLLRAVWPENRRPDFWQNGRLRSAALKDPKGLSVDRSFGRSMVDAVNFTKSHLSGFIVSLTVPDCKSVNAQLVYKPNCSNKYHSEIHGSDNSLILSDTQALILSRHAKIEYSRTATLYIDVK